jgi:hypothetical protein
MITFIPSSGYANIMAENAATADRRSHFDQIKTNLRSWSFFEWIFLWIVIPALLFIVYAIPQNIKNTFFILNTANPWGIQTYLLYAYTHTQLFWHLIGNVAFYLVTLLLIFAFENNKRRFWIMVLNALFLVPIITSILTISFFGILGRAITSQGFSAIDGAFLAYAIVITVIGIVQDTFERFDHPELFAHKRFQYYISLVLSCVLLSLIGIMGIIFGLFVNTGGQIVNGLAHFGGFITGLIVFLLFDITTEKRKIFAMQLSFVIVIGIIWYVNYLMNMIKF